MLTLAKRLAQKSDNQFKHAALILSSGRLIGQGYNSTTQHAESRAIKQAKNLTLIKKSTLISIRVNETGEFRNSRPCIWCLEGMKDAKIKRVIFYLDGGWVELDIKK